MERKKLGFMNINRGEILTRDEMRSVLAGSGGSGGQECNCLYCYGFMGSYMSTYPVHSCNFDPNSVCIARGYESGNFGICH